MERVVLLFVQVLIVPALTAERPTKTTTSNECTLPLGMEEGKIPDDAITASSSYEMKSVGPQNARIRQEKNGGAWCPKAQISNAIREYLEVDLTKDHLIAWTETQGRFGNGQGQEYAEAFFLEYWRDGKWHQYKTLKGDKVLRGNSNTYLVERQKLDLPFVASRVRFVPYSQHPRTVCMRVEIYGCIWERRILSYVAPKGEADGPNGCNLEDFSYDGIEIDGIVRNGLGQLTDGILGDIADILSSSTSTNWVGWSNCSIVELVFEFYDIREFENCTIHVADLPEYEIEVFSTVLVWFSFNGRAYHSIPEKLEITEKAKTNSNNYFISLQSRTGRFVKLEIRTRSKWLIISEVTFKSVPGARNISDESSERSSSRNNSAIGRDYSEKTIGHPNETIFELNEADLTPDAFPVGNSQAYVGLVSGILTVTALLLTCTIFLMKQRGRNKVALLQKHTALLCGSPAPGITINVKDVKLTTSIVANGTNLSQSRLSLKSCKSSVITSDRSTREPLATRSCGSNVISSDYEHCSFDAHHQYSSEDDPIYETHPQLGNSGSIVESSDTDDQSTTRDTFDSKTVYSFANDCPVTSMPIVFSSEKSTTSGNHQVTRSSQKFYDSYYAATDILTIRRREQMSAASLFTPLRIRNSTRPLNNLNSHAMRRISRHRLRILDKLGEGSFGLVHLCEAKGIQTVDLGVVRNRQTVIVRSLWRGVVDSLREDFRRDMHVLATIRDVNIAGVIALVEEEPFGAVFEYGDLGDLPTFLENHEASNGGAHLSSECCIAFVAQIASGMRYLESLNIPHCDLAARNCIVDQHLTIKVSDHAMYCNKYDRQYYVDGSYKKVPLRWMAWEAIILNKHSCRTDVWSYAVTVWEILSQCKNLPYSELTSEQVLENCSRWYHDNGTTERDRPRILPQPSCCSDELYRTMLKCWSKQPEERPTFDEIYFRLKKSGYD